MQQIGEIEHRRIRKSEEKSRTEQNGKSPGTKKLPVRAPHLGTMILHTESLQGGKGEAEAETAHPHKRSYAEVGCKHPPGQKKLTERHRGKERCHRAQRDQGEETPPHFLGDHVGLIGGESHQKKARSHSHEDTAEGEEENVGSHKKKEDSSEHTYEGSPYHGTPHSQMLRYRSAERSGKGTGPEKSTYHHPCGLGRKAPDLQKPSKQIVDTQKTIDYKIASHKTYKY
jgi:hypothetical protein